MANEDPISYEPIGPVHVILRAGNRNVRYNPNTITTLVGSGWYHNRPETVYRATNPMTRARIRRSNLIVVGNPSHNINTVIIPPAAVPPALPTQHVGFLPPMHIGSGRGLRRNTVTNLANSIARLNLHRPMENLTRGATNSGRRHGNLTIWIGPRGGLFIIRNGRRVRISR